jgi:hypothetical protein
MSEESSFWRSLASFILKHTKYGSHAIGNNPEFDELDCMSWLETVQVKTIMFKVILRFKDHDIFTFSKVYYPKEHKEYLVQRNIEHAATGAKKRGIAYDLVKGIASENAKKEIPYKSLDEYIDRIIKEHDKVEPEHLSLLVNQEEGPTSITLSTITLFDSDVSIRTSFEITARRQKIQLPALLYQWGPDVYNL